MTPSEIGERAEAAILAALVRSGKEILIPFGQRRYDLAYEDKGSLVKVQCKTGHERSGAIWFKTHSVCRGQARDYREDASVFGIYCHERNEVYLVPVQDVPARYAHLRLHDACNGQQAGVRWASKYLLR